MVTNRILEEISGKLSQAFADSPAGEVEKNIRAVLQSAFARLDLVTRGEFDIQQQVLLRTREKLERLEAAVAELEKQAGIGGGQTPPAA